MASCVLQTVSKLLPTLTLHAAGNSQVFWPDVLCRLKGVTTTVIFILDTWGDIIIILSNRRSRKKSEYLGRL